jgi:protein-S-isoprenylcysteine O-methyltransferase Ste14
MFYRWLFSSLFLAMWVGFLVLWRVLASRVKAPATAENLRSRLSHVIALLVAICLFAAPDVPLPPLNARFLPLALWPPALGAALTFIGLAFSVWARFTLADNWSSDVQVKRGHELIVEGPYRWVRHPIYTGLILAFVGTALAVGEWRAVLGVAFAALAFWRKLSIEEKAMRGEFGEAYVRYAERVPALIPFII